MTAPTELPLAGIKVIDFTQVMMGPVATQMLGDYGADVIKIERPPTGDLSRTSIPDDPAGLTGPVFCSLNRNKRSIVLDLRKRGGQGAVLTPDRRGADVVVNNFRAGVMERMGFGYDELHEAQSAADLCGRHRLRPHRPLRAQGRAGRAGAGDVRRDGARAPTRACRCRSTATTFADYSAGMHLVQGVLLALLQRREDRARPAGQRVAARLHARRADAGGGDAHDARARGELGRDAAHRRLRDHSTARS